MDSYNSNTTKPIYKSVQIVWLLLSIVETLLAFRFVLKMMGANPAAGFSSFIYNVTWFFAQPFLTVFNKTYIAGSIFEWTTLLAMFVYWILAIGIIKVFLMSKTVSTPEAAAALEQEQQ